MFGTTYLEMRQVLTDINGVLAHVQEIFCGGGTVRLGVKVLVLVLGVNTQGSATREPGQRRWSLWSVFAACCVYSIKYIIAFSYLKYYHVYVEMTTLIGMCELHHIQVSPYAQTES